MQTYYCCCCHYYYYYYYYYYYDDNKQITIPTYFNDNYMKTTRLHGSLQLRYTWLCLPWRDRCAYCTVLVQCSVMSHPFAGVMKGVGQKENDTSHVNRESTSASQVNFRLFSLFTSSRSVDGSSS